MGLGQRRQKPFYHISPDALEIMLFSAIQRIGNLSTRQTEVRIRTIEKEGLGILPDTKLIPPFNMFLILLVHVTIYFLYKIFLPVPIALTPSVLNRKYLTFPFLKLINKDCKIYTAFLFTDLEVCCTVYKKASEELSCIQHRVCRPHPPTEADAVTQSIITCVSMLGFHQNTWEEVIRPQSHGVRTYCIEPEH